MKYLLGIEYRLISPYHPEANGAAEAAVKVIKNLLNKNSKGDIYNWDKYLATVQLQINCRILKRTGSQPFELYFGRPWNTWKNYAGTTSQVKSQELILQTHK